MAARHTTTFTALTLALLLGACGGENTEEPDSTLDEPAAEPADPAAEAVDAAESAVEDTTDTVAAETSETVADSADAIDGGWDAMQEDWDSSAGMVKDRWAELTEEEILATGGDREQLVALVQDTYGIEREQAEQEVNDWVGAL